VKEHPWAAIGTGCAEQIEEGTVPNQYGTWPLGRGGWCPGKDVPAWRVDVTAAIDAGGDSVISYQSRYDGAPYVPVPVTSGSTGFAGRIDMASWLVLYR
jgi:hypothetical protein